MTNFKSELHNTLPGPHIYSVRIQRTARYWYAVVERKADGQVSNVKEASLNMLLGRLKYMFPGKKLFLQKRDRQSVA